MTRRLLGVGAVDLCVEDFGDPDDPTVLLVHGAAASMDWWDTGLCERIAAGGRHVVRYDHRDTGESTTVEPGRPAYDGGQLDRDCRGLIAALDDGPVHLVGLSMGGGIAQAVALRHPELVRTLTLLDTSPVGGVDTDLPGPTPALSETFEHPPPDPDWLDADSYVEWVVASQRPYAGSHGLDEARVRAIARAIHARSHDVAAANNHWLAIGAPSHDTDGDADRDADEDAEPLDVHLITVPTLVLHGTDDPLFPIAHGRALAEAIPGATFVELPETGHETPPATTWSLFVSALLAHTG